MFNSESGTSGKVNGCWVCKPSVMGKAVRTGKAYGHAENDIKADAECSPTRTCDRSAQSRTAAGSVF